MADLNEPIRSDDGDELPDLGQVPYGQEHMEPDDDDSPRRSASARFIVDAPVGSEAAMRDAMDPANQSLADALRLSFRVLQAVILVLVLLFLVSGFQTVDDGQSGVRTVWGAIVMSDGAEALTPGAKFSVFPYPIAEFVLFRSENRTVDLGTAFAPMSRPGETHQEMLDRADLSTPLMPGRDGSLLTRDGDLAHLELSAQYAIDQAGPFVRRINDNDRQRDADTLVKLALQSAAVQVAAGASVQELIDQTDEIRLRIQQNAQQSLDRLQCGVVLTQVQVARAYAPLAIEKVLGDLQEARVTAAEAIDKARQKANETLNKIAGKDHAALNALIEQYEDARDRGDEPRETELLASINKKLDDNDGDVAQIIQTAKAFQSQIDASLGNEYRRFASLLPAYRKNPELLVRQQWLDAYAHVFNRPDAETIYVPGGLLSMSVNFSGSATVQETRRKAELARKEREADMIGFDPTRPYISHGSDINLSGPGRQLNIEDGKAVPIGTPR